MRLADIPYDGNGRPWLGITSIAIECGNGIFDFVLIHLVYASLYVTCPCGADVEWQGSNVDAPSVPRYKVCFASA